MSFTSDTHINPAEIGLYYLQSRYYDPQIGRFINSDTLSIISERMVSLTDKNLYSYCNNNPVIHFDENGKFPALAVVAYKVETTLVDVGIGVASSLACGKYEKIISGGAVFLYHCYKEGEFFSALGAWVFDEVATYYSLFAVVNKKIDLDIDSKVDDLLLAKFQFNKRAVIAPYALMHNGVKSMATRETQTPEYLITRNGRLMM